MTSASTETVRVIWRCRRRSCKHVWAFNYRLSEGSDIPYRLLADGTRRWLTEDRFNGLSCPKCGCSLPKGEQVRGRYSASHACGPRCLNAIGPSCDCQCGGKNHGANHVM